MTPQTRKVLPDALLNARIGQQTLAGALNDQIRFRVLRAPQLADWQIVPDSPMAQAVMQSKAGASLVRQLHASIQTMRNEAGKSTLKGFILPKDTEGVLAGAVLSSTDSKGDADGKALLALAAQGKIAEAGKHMQGFRAQLDDNIRFAGAWNADGWITYMPDIARMLLIPSGAYKPGTGEERMHQATKMANYVAGVNPHEVQHSVSTASPTAYQGLAKWMEEGTANVFSFTPVFHRQLARAQGVTPASFNSGLRTKSDIDLGWGVWNRPKPKVDPNSPDGGNAHRNYDVSQVVLRDLVRMGGADFRSKAGQQKAFDILQGASMRYTAGRLATAIIEHNDLDPKVYEKLRQRIAGAVDLPRGAKDIAAEFGIAA
jgi:hypothetical protein